MGTQFMMTWFYRLLLISVCTGSLIAKESAEGETVYAFRAVDVTVQTKWGDAPVVTAGRWSLRVDTPAGVKRVSYKRNFRLEARVGFTTEIIEVSTFETSLSYQRKYELESQARAELQQYRSGTEAAIANLNAGDLNISANTEERTQQLNYEYSQLEETIQQSLAAGDYGSLELKDSIAINLELISPRDIEEAYCLVLLGYNVPNPTSPGGREFENIGRIIRIGDLKANAVEKSKLRLRVPAGYLEDAHYIFYLLTGESENLATTKSLGLRELTSDERAELNL